MKYLVFSLLFLGFIFPYSQINAQIGARQEDLVVEMTPSNPGPNQSVSVSLNSFVFSIDSARISWILNGASKKSGRGEKNFTFETGGMGSQTTLRIVVETADGYVAEKTIRIKPGEVDLIWETESYVPPFYKGKALFSYQNKINFIAIPHIT